MEAAVLKSLFVPFPGFREVRLIEARPGIAFAEFEGELQAGAALAGLQGLKVDDEHTMAITYAKR
jgi:U2 small nuclear ribonucleoprotein B''